MLVEYITWWYSQGLLKLFKYLKAFIVILANVFSVRMAVTTFFAPWKRDNTPTKGQPLDVKFKIWGFNLIARGFGMVIKFFVLVVFLLVFVILLALEVAVSLLWLFLPFLVAEIFLLGIFYLQS
ncbi:hypothetical protein KJ903_02330 [Patescibacteria group bacterium]|nr:hypothetical protein [Patescibacteria group bacterium]